jgi:hypothetical protein
VIVDGARVADQRHLDLDALLADPARTAEVPAGGRQAVLDALAVHEGRCRLVRDLLTVGLAVKENNAPELVDGVAHAEWLSAREVSQWLGCSDRTVRRRMRDGTWRRGEHWFQPKGSRPRFSRRALEAWVLASDESVPTMGLAYGPDIPHGRRRRRLASLRNK